MATFKVIHYNSKTLSNGENPIMLQVIHERKVKRIGLGYSCSQAQWHKDKQRFRRNMPNYKDKNRNLQRFEMLATKILDNFLLQGRPFSFELFEKKFRKKGSTSFVYDFIEILLKEMEQKGKAGNRTVYRDTRNALQKYRPSKTLMFADIDYKFLKGWEAHLFSRGCTSGGIGVRMRTLRAVLNEAIRRGDMAKELYPFSTQENKNGYSITHLKSKKSPRALSMEDIERLKDFPITTYPELKKSHAYFMFSYYCRGMNFTDMAYLKRENIYNKRIDYKRKKTGQEFSIGVTPQAQEILDYFKEIKENNNNYVFPILSDFHQTPQQQKDRIKKCTKYYNKDLKRMAAILEIPINLTSYVARHTFGNVLKAKNVPISVISEMYGHDNIETTKFYLAKFENTVLDEAANLL